MVLILERIENIVQALFILQILKLPSLILKLEQSFQDLRSISLNSVGVLTLLFEFKFICEIVEDTQMPDFMISF
jgi:hypothetical protein